MLKSSKYIYLYGTFELVIHPFMKKFLLISAVVVAAGMFSSCYQDPGPGTGKVIVVDVNDFRVPSATVKLSQPGQLGTGYIVNEGLTDVNGEYAYTHEPALEVILNISATYGAAVGQGIIRIKPDETSTETVKIY